MNRRLPRRRDLAPLLQFMPGRQFGLGGSFGTLSHTAIVDALRDRDPDGAQAAMRRHLHNVADSLLGRR